MRKNILSVVVGIVLAVVSFVIFESVNAALHPLPQNFDANNVEAYKNHFLHQPITVWLLVLLGWFIGSALCGFIIKVISKNETKKLPLIAGILLTLSAVLNFYLLPHPTWFVILGLCIFIPATLFGFSIKKIKKN